MRRDATQSLYVDGPGECDIVEREGRREAVKYPGRVAGGYLSNVTLARRQVASVSMLGKWRRFCCCWS